MPRRRKYSVEFKREAVALVQSGEVPASQIARDLGINGNMLNHWCRDAAHPDGKAFRGQGKARDEEMAALKRELAQERRRFGY